MRGRSPSRSGAKQREHGAGWLRPHSGPPEGGDDEGTAVDRGMVLRPSAYGGCLGKGSRDSMPRGTALQTCVSL
ncbi:unnamed protein product [Arctogadus glacialis]